MKTLSIQQPWASLIVAGLKDVENRTWKTNYRGRVLIHASGKKIPKNNLYTSNPAEVIQEISNIIYMNGMPNFNELPLGTIIGYVDIVDIKDENYLDSVWAQGAPCQWIVDNAYIFDNPITDVKGKLGLWEYDIDENNLPPAYRACPPRLVAEGEEIVMPVSDEFYNVFMQRQFFKIYTIQSVMEVLTEVEGDANGYHPIKSFNTIRLKLPNGEEHRFALPDGILHYEETDENDDVPTFFSLYDDKKVPLYFLEGVLGKEL
jgi:conserved domain protein